MPDHPARALTLWMPELAPLLKDWQQQAQTHPDAAQAFKTLDQAWQSLRSLMSQGDFYRPRSRSFEAQASFLFHQSQPLPAAPVLAKLLTEATPSPEQGFWVAVSPVQMVPDRDTLRLFPPDTLALTQEESKALCHAFNQHFESDGVTLHYLSVDVWLMFLPQAVDLTTTGLAEASLQPVSQSLPQGQAATYWQSLQNEAQMLFHQHPVNQARQTQGLPPANGIWFWGEGSLPHWAPRPQAAVFSDELYLQALAQITDSQSQGACADWSQWWEKQKAQPATHSLVHVTLPSTQNTDAVFDDWVALEKYWFAPLRDALKAQTVQSVFIDLGGMGQFYLTPPKLKRFWRRKRPLHHWLAFSSKD